MHMALMVQESRERAAAGEGQQPSDRWSDTCPQSIEGSVHLFRRWPSAEEASNDDSRISRRERSHSTSSSAPATHHDKIMNVQKYMFTVHSMLHQFTSSWSILLPAPPLQVPVVQCGRLIPTQFWLPRWKHRGKTEDAAPHMLTTIVCSRHILAGAHAVHLCGQPLVFRRTCRHRTMSSRNCRDYEAGAVQLLEIEGQDKCHLEDRGGRSKSRFWQKWQT